MAAPDLDVIKDIPGYKVILKAVLKSQIQQLVEQLASTTEEESVILTASVADGTLSHLGSESGKGFLEDHEDIKSQFLGFCLKKHHRDQQEKERQQAEAAIIQATQAAARNRSPRGTYPGRSPRFSSPHGPGPVHPVALTRTPRGGRLRSPGNRHEPYPTARPPRRTSTETSPSVVNNSGQVIKIEPESGETNENDQDTNQSVTAPSSAKYESGEKDEDDKSESSNSTIPNEPQAEGLGIDSDFSNVIAGSSQTQSGESGEIDPNVIVKMEAMTESEMELEITGVEPGRPGVPQDNWDPNVSLGMNFDPTQGAAGNQGDLSAQGFTSLIVEEEKLASHQYARPPAGIYDVEFASQHGMEELFCSTDVYIHKDQLYTALNKSSATSTTSPKGGSTSTGRDGKRVARYLLTVFFTMEELRQSSVTACETSMYRPLNQQIVEAIIAFSVFNSDTSRADIMKAMRASLTSKRCKAKKKSKAKEHVVYPLQLITTDFSNFTNNVGVPGIGTIVGISVGDSQGKVCKQGVTEEEFHSQMLLNSSVKLEPGVQQFKNILPRLQIKKTIRSEFVESSETEQTKGNKIRNAVWKKHACETCGKRFEKKSKLDRHSVVHTGEKKYFCELCGKGFGFKESLREHLKRMHKDGEIPLQNEKICGICFKSFPHPVKLREHMVSHTGAKPFVCKICSKSFGYNSCLIRHHQQNHSEKKYCCEICGKMFGIMPYLEEHRRCVHKLGEGAAFKSEIPVVKNDSKDITKIMGAAIIDTGNEKETDVEETEGELDINTNSAASAETLLPLKFGEAYTVVENNEENLDKVSEDKEDNVSIVSKTDNNSDVDETDAVDTLKVLPDTEYGNRCKICGKEFPSVYKLNRHMSSHKTQREFHCDICNKAYKEKGTLKHHRETIHNLGKDEIWPFPINASK